MAALDKKKYCINIENREILNKRKFLTAHGRIKILRTIENIGQPEANKFNSNYTCNNE